MKLKELKKTVNVSWSPAEQYPIYLAAGSAAQQLDPSFSSSSQLELYSLNLEEAGFDLELKSSIQTQNKFQKLVWSGAGVIVGGCDGGLLEFYSVEKLMNSSADSLLSSVTKHNGQVSALDVNPYQRNLLASGASDSEIFIWDLNNTSQPMALGNRSQPLEHVQGLGWNQQVQHILGSTFSSRCVVWDLRKNEPIMKLSDSASRTRWRALAWHPSVATQLCLASEDDHSPVIQLWDLRLAASPLLTLEGHHSGVMSLSWCRQDPDLLLSAGKDGRVLCWNPNTKDPNSQLVCEVSSQEQWVFEAAWSPRCPALLAAAGADQRVAVYSLLGGSRPESSPNQSNIMDSFGGADSFLQLPAVSRAAAPATADASPMHPPKWLARPRGARFAFGGKLITFDKCPQEEKTVYVSQVVSEPAMVSAAPALEAVLAAARSADPSAAEQLAEYCRQKGDAATEQTERYTWYFLRANFLPNFRMEALNLLGFKQDELPSKFKGLNSSGDVAQNEVAALSRGESTETEAELSTDTSTDLSDAHTLVERKLANLDLNATPTNVLIPNGDDPSSLICRALAVGRLEEAVELCLAANRLSDAMVIASTGGPDLITKVQQYHLSSAGQDPVSLLAGCVSAGRWAALAKAAAPRGWRLVLAALLTHASEEDAAKYCELLGDRLAQESDPGLAEAATLCYLCAMSADAVVSRSRNALAALAELAAVARRAASARGRTVEPGGKVESVLIEYASRLASAGCLDAAASALAGLQRAELRDRLAGALGQRNQVQPSPAQQRPAPRRSLPGHTYTAPTNPYEAQSPWQPSVPVSGYGGFAPAPAPAPAAPPSQPPRAPSTGPSTGGITSRSKYKVDPSVQSAPLYNQYNFNNPPPQQYGYNSPAPEQYGANPGLAPLNPAPMNPGLTNQGINSGINNPGFNPGLNNSGLNPGLHTNPILNSGIPLNQSNPGLNPGMSNPGMNPGMNPGVLNAGAGVNGGYYQPPVEQAVAAMPVKAAAPGWNDPPMMTKPKSKPEVPIQAPITQPLFGMEQIIPLNPAQYPGQQYQDQQYTGQQYQDQYQGQQYQGPQYGQQPFQQQGQYAGAPTQAYTPQSSSPIPPAPLPAPAPKPPLPERHRPLQAALDALRERCHDTAANPQMKRKLEDVKKKLESLYDILREERLSESAVNSLHSCVSHAQGGDYQSAVAVSAALASGPDFAAAASFIPGLKVLFQLAQQLQVYL